jgi:hypothetical protein
MEFSNHSVDFSESVFNPSHIVGSILNFGFNEFSVGNSAIINTSVGVHNRAQITNLGGLSIDLGVVGDVKGGSLVQSGLSESVKDVHDSVDGISSLFLELEELDHLVGGGHVEFGLGEGDNNDE